MEATIRKTIHTAIKMSLYAATVCNITTKICSNIHITPCAFNAQYYRSHIHIKPSTNDLNIVYT